MLKKDYYAHSIACYFNNIREWFLKNDAANLTIVVKLLTSNFLTEKSIVHRCLSPQQTEACIHAAKPLEVVVDGIQACLAIGLCEKLLIDGGANAL